MPTANDNRYDPRAYPRDRSLRVGDQERDAVSEILRQQHVEGRLDVEEFQARLERCLAAKTYAELDELIADFPREEAEPQPMARTWNRRRWPLAVPFLFVLLIVAATHGHAAWLAVPLVFFFVVRPLACGPRRRVTRVSPR